MFTTVTKKRNMMITFYNERIKTKYHLLYINSRFYKIC